MRKSIIIFITLIISINSIATGYHPTPNPDRSYYNFNNSLGLLPGDTVYFGAQYDWGFIFLDRVNGTKASPIVLINEGGQTVIRGSQIKLQSCKYLKVVGTGSVGVQYGLKVQPYAEDSLGFGFFGVYVRDTSRNIEFSNIYIRHSGLGLVIEQDGSCDTTFNYPNWVLDSFDIHDCLFKVMWNQGMYIGNTNPDNQAPPAAPGFTPRPVICETLFGPGSATFSNSASTIVVSGNLTSTFVSGVYISIQGTSSNNTNNCSVSSSSFGGGNTTINITNYDGTITNETAASTTIKRVYYYKAVRAGHVNVYNNIIDSCGRSGIQMSAVSQGIPLIYNNNVRHCGLNGDPAQGFGIVWGSYTHPYVHDNTIINTYSWGITSLGGSGTGIPMRIEDNTIDSSGYLPHYNLGSATNINPNTEPTFANTIDYAYSMFLKTGLELTLDSSEFYIKRNTLGKRQCSQHGEAAIGFNDGTNWFQKVGNLICNNTNTVAATPLTFIETGFGLYTVVWSTDCATITPIPNLIRGYKFVFQ